MTRRWKKFGKRNRAILDTNVLIKGLLDPSGTPAQILDLLHTGLYELAVSKDILEEYRETLEEFPKVPSFLRKALLRKIRFYSKMVHPRKCFHVVRDVKDNIFIECAVEAHAKYLVTRDYDLLALDPFRGIVILEPNAYLEILKLTLTSFRHRR